jgi:hypothetical protein
MVVIGADAKQVVARYKLPMEKFSEKTEADHNKAAAITKNSFALITRTPIALPHSLSQQSRRWRSVKRPAALP